MSDCPDDNLLVAYGAGALSPEETQALELHLDGCELCRTLAAEAVQQDAPLDTDPSADDGDGLPALGPGAVLGRYVVLGRLGAGGMGTVYSAFDPKLERHVAIKLLHVETRRDEDAGAAQDRLLREAQAMARLTHPNVVSIFDVGTWRDRVFLAMEYVDGGTLRRWFSQADRSQQELLAALSQAGRGLQAAHDAGLVHRDFKPDNVLVSSDGRVLVTDFGLAHAHVGPLASPDQRPGTETSEVLALLEVPFGPDAMDSTRTGALVGTPAYMAPEQLLRQTADARSDQFAFCVTAWEVLCGRRPFELEDLSQLAASLLATQSAEAPPSAPSGRVAPLPLVLPPPDVRLPSHVQRVLQRGLRLDPAQRFASMGDLLTDFERDPAARRRTTWTLAILCLAVVLAVGSWTWQWTQARALRCTGGTARASAAWGPPQQRALAERFRVVDASLGSTAALRVAELLTERSASWALMHRESCLATRVSGVQSEEILTLRVACLDRRMQELDGLVRLFLSADLPLVDRSVNAVMDLPPLESCSDLAGLLAPVPLPEDGVERAKVVRITEALAQVRVLFLAGRYQEGLVEAEAVWARAKDSGHAPTRAEAGFLLGHLLEKNGRAEEALTALRTASLDGDRGRDDRVRVEAAKSLTILLIERGQLDDAAAQWELGDVALERLGSPAALQSSLQLTRGLLHGASGDAEAALAAYREAAAGFAASLGDDSPKRSVALANMANELSRLGRFDEAGWVLTEAIAIDTALLGDAHPSLVPSNTVLAGLESEGGQHDAALATIGRVERLVQAHYPRTHRRRMWTLDAKATILQKAGRWAESLQVYRQSLALKLEILPEGDPELSYPFDGIGQCLLAQGRPLEAVPNLERALELVRSDPLARGDTRFALARALTALAQDPGRVAQLLAGALEDFAQAKRSDKQAEVSAWRAPERAADRSP